MRKTTFYLYMPMSLGLFFCGAALAFFFVFEPVLNFLFGFNRQMNIDTQPRISEWISFVLFLPLGFGISFPTPLSDVVAGKNRCFYHPNLSKQLENRRVDHLCIGDVPDTGGPGQHALDGAAADHALLRRDWVMQVVAEEVESYWPGN